MKDINEGIVDLYTAAFSCQSAEDARLAGMFINPYGELPDNIDAALLDEAEKEHWKIPLNARPVFAVWGPNSLGH